MDTAHPQSVLLNGVELDLGTGLLRAPDGSDVPLRPQSLSVLRHLVDRAGHVISKDELMDAVWPGIAVTDNSLSQCISEIRKAIGDEAQVILKTVARRGYRLVLREAAPALRASVDAASGRPARWHSPRWMAQAGFGLLAVVILTTLMWWPTREVEVPAALSIAVLPFENLSEVEEQAYLADGVTDDLTTELARVPGLFVVSRNAARGYRDSALAPVEIARALGVRHLLQGSVQRVGDEVRINAQLVDASTEAQVWAQRFDGTFAGVFDLQNQVVAEIVDALQVRLVPGKANLAVSGDTDSPEAFQAMRRAIEARRQNTPEGMVEALSYLRQALAIDPEFGAAAAEMAWLYWDADEARLQALGINWDESAVRMHESLDLAARNPPPGYFQLTADLLTREHRSDEAIVLLQRAIPLDPSDAWTYEGLTQTLAFNGRPGEAKGYLDTAMRVDPGWTDWRRFLAGLVAFGEGRYADAAAVIEEMDLSAPDPWSKFYAIHLLVAAYAHLDRTSEMQRAMDSLHRVATYAGEGGPDLLNVQRFFVYKDPADSARLIDGLRKAGVPELPAGIAVTAVRLDGIQIAELILGRRLVGRLARPYEDTYELTVATDGSITKTVGAEVWHGHMWVQGNYLCTAYPRVLTDCGVVTRKPGGSTAGRDEYRFDIRYRSYEFTVEP